MVLESQLKGKPLTNYASYKDPISKTPRIGHYDASKKTIQPLAFISGTRVKDLYQVIEAGEDNIIASGSPVSLSSTKILAPITGRDILCVGKNYAAHAKEFNTSGFDSSDKVDIPTHPVIFTKRFSSIIGDGDEIHPHQDFTKTADYEGEIGVIIGKSGFRITESNAMDHVWGYTIINDMTARERQRDHKQFYLGKSLDTFCPMGPIAVPARNLEKVLRVQTHVNGEIRQDATTEDLIFSIPFLIKTMSEGQTLMSGDVIATGTPAGVGIGLTPPVYLKPGDEIAVSIAGLGTLTNRIASYSSANPTSERIASSTSFVASNSSRTIDPSGLALINNKPLNYATDGYTSRNDHPIVFVHGLGGSVECWLPIMMVATQLPKCHLFDLEGHGLSPTLPLSVLSIESFADDLKGLFDHAKINSRAVIVAHSFGCLVAVKFAIDNPELVKGLVLIGPPPSPIPDHFARDLKRRADGARTTGMMAAFNNMSPHTSISAKTMESNPVVYGALRLAITGQDVEGYAKACTAFAEAAATKIDFSLIEARTCIITGSADRFSTPKVCQTYEKELRDSAGLKILEDVGHWAVLEDVKGVAQSVSSFVQESL